jgi:hypothetical protein
VVLDPPQRRLQVGHHLLRPDDPDRPGGPACLAGQLAAAPEAITSEPVSVTAATLPISTSGLANIRRISSAAVTKELWTDE